MILRHSGSIRRRPHTPGIAMGMAVALIVFLVLAVAAAAGAARPAKHKVDGTVNAARVGGSGTSNTVAGTFSGTPFGSGAVVYKTTPAGTNLSAKFRAFNERGSFRGTTLVTPAPQADGTTSFTGKLQITGGTVRYRGAKGKDLVITGSFNPQTNIFIFRITGNVTY